MISNDDNEYIYIYIHVTHYVFMIFHVCYLYPMIPRCVPPLNSVSVLSSRWVPSGPHALQSSWRVSMPSAR